MFGWSQLPIFVVENFMLYLNIRDFFNCALVCRNWLSIFEDENNEIWRRHLYNLKLGDDITKSDVFANYFTFKEKIRAYFYAWNPSDCSRNMYVKLNHLTVHRNPIAQSTDACRGKMGVNYGRHSWEIWWEGPLGTVAVVGIALKQAVMQCHGYMPLLGNDNNSWGWNIVDNNILHNGVNLGNYPAVNNAPKYQVGDRIKLIIDCKKRIIYFEKHHEFLGIAFRNLPENATFYPAISAVYGNTEVSMVYFGPPFDG